MGIEAAISELKKLVSGDESNANIENQKIPSKPASALETTASNSPTSPPAIPPRTYPQQPSSTSSDVIAVRRRPLWQQLIIVSMITGAFSVIMITFVKKYVVSYINSMISAKQQLFSHQLDLFKKFNENLASFESLKRLIYPKTKTNKFIIENPREINGKDDDDNDDDDDDDNDDDDDDDDDKSTELGQDTNEIISLKFSTSSTTSSLQPSLLTTLSTDLTSIAEKLKTHQEFKNPEEEINEIQVSLGSLVTYLSTTTNTLPGSMIDESFDASQIKKEIRSIKGLFTNRMNFPKVPPMQTYSQQQKLKQPQSLPQPQPQPLPQPQIQYHSQQGLIRSQSPILDQIEISSKDTEQFQDDQS